MLRKGLEGNKLSGLDVLALTEKLIFALLIDPLCKGSTTDFGSVSQGSNPCGSTFFLVKCVD